MVLIDTATFGRALISPLIPRQAALAQTSMR